MTKARVITIQFLVEEEEPGDRDYLTRELVAKSIQEWYDESGGFGGNFQVLSAETVEDDGWWWRNVWSHSSCKICAEPMYGVMPVHHHYDPATGATA